MFAETFADHALPGPFIILSEVDSTNNYAMAKLHAGVIQAGCCFQAVEQTSGKGQRGRHWVSEKGSNITMSLCLRPVHPEYPFLHAASMALGCYDFIKACNISGLSVKWPNDVYIGDRKAAGILIENLIRGDRWEASVVGVGVNVNQAEFGDLQAKATSLRAASGRVLDVTASAKDLHRCLLARHAWAAHATADGIMEAYNAVLYQRGRTQRLKQGSAVFTTRIERVTETGELVTRDTMERLYRVGEIEFV